MISPAKILGFASAAVLAGAMVCSPAFGQTTNTNTNTNTTNPAGTKQTQCPQGTTGAAQGMTPANPSASTPGTPSNSTGQNTSQTTAGTPTTSNNPSGTGTTTTQTPMSTNSANGTPYPNCNTPTTAPANMQNPQSNGPGGMEMNAITNNPNGSNWLDKFNRPVAHMTTPGMPMHYGMGKHHKSKHRAKRASGGGGH